MPPLAFYQYVNSENLSWIDKFKTGAGFLAKEIKFECERQTVK